MRQAGLGKSEAAAFPFLLILAVPWPAAGQALCGDRDEITQRLEEGYQERLKEAGLTDGGSLIELWASNDTWTLLVTYPSGISCLMAAGRDWQDMPDRERSPL